MKGVRELGLPILWGNGLELKKATLGRGLPNGDPTPDEDLVRALWGWDGSVGCYHAFIPAERPISGREAYPKLLPWEQHRAMMEAIARAGLPALTYGVIVGLPDDSHETLFQLEGAITDLCGRLKTINPALRFVVVPYAIRPFLEHRCQGRFNPKDLCGLRITAIVGGFWTACANTTLHINYKKVSDWQERLMAIGDPMTQW